MANSLKKIIPLFMGLCLALGVQAEIVLLNFYADGNHVITNYEAESGNTYTLASILSSEGVSISGCRGYDFRGWIQGEPLAPGEDPTSRLVTNVTPTKNMDFYAVYQKAGGATNRYVRITSTKDLRAGDQYLLVCYYDHDGETYYGPSYFAMGNTERNDLDAEYYPTGDTYSYYEYDVYAHRYSISAEQIYPDGGVYENPANSIIWTLGGGEGAWTLRNTAANNSLYIRDGFSQAWYVRNGNLYAGPSAYNHHILDASGNSFVITSSNGKFNFKSGSYYLTYSDDENDYFKTGTSNSWAFYLYKKESAYTSYPDCAEWIVNFDALDGTVGATGEHTSSLPDNGSGVTLPTAVKPTDVTCANWTFAGWTPETPIKGTTRAPKLYAAGTNYKPVYDGETLYAVYRPVYYEEVTRRSNLTTTDSYVIVYNNNTAVTYNNNNTTWAGTSIAISGAGTQKTIVPEATANMLWKYNASQYFYCGTDNNTYRLRNSGTNGGANDFTTSGGCRFSYKSGATTYYLRWTGTNFAYQSTNSQNAFKIYKQVLGSYSSYPHCTAYTVTLYGCGGEIDGIENKFEETITESAAGEGVDLPTIVTPYCDALGEWEFAGWLEGGDLSSSENLDFTGLQTGTFVPSHNNAILYAVFKRRTNKFWIMQTPGEMVSDDHYVITGYDGVMDWAVSSSTITVSGDNYLRGIETPSPQGSSGYYVEVDDDNNIWLMSGTGTSCTFRNLGNSKYLASANSTPTGTGNTATTYGFTRNSSSGGFSFSMKDTGRSRYLKLNTSGDNHYFSMLNSSSAGIFVYRNVKEYTSWPHCEKFTVNYNAGGGTVSGPSSKEEDAPYAGVILPDASANTDCRKEGWNFAGWATAPITEESSELMVDLLPAGTHYRLTSDGITLYAVYYQKEDTYKKITSMDDLKMGVNYIIATTSGSSAGRAVGNTPKATNYIDAVSVTATANTITTTNPSIQWRIQRSSNGEYEFFNTADNVYWDLRNLGTENSTDYAKLTSNEAKDNFIISYSGAFIIRSVISLAKEIKYLGYDSGNTRFKTVNSDNLTALYFYQQEALYHSNPSCIQASDALLWEKTNAGTYVTLESYQLSGAPTMPGAIGYPTLQSDGTYKYKYDITECSTTTVTWDGTTSTLRIPYIANSDQVASTLLPSGDCPSCDVVVMPDKTLTINRNTKLHTLTLQEGATLNVTNGYTLTVNSLVLSANGDQKSPKVNLNASGNIELEHGELYYDLRIPNDRYYWFALPYSTKLSDISYSNEAANGGKPTLNTDYYLYFYNGKLRGEDANGGAQDATYWHPVASTTINAGQGYLFGLADDAVGTFNSQTYSHTKRVIRFAMTPPVSTWLNDERSSGYKIGTVAPTTAVNPRNAVHMGWNLIGNPYMHTYNTGTTSGLVNGEWEKEKIGDYETNYYVQKTGTTTIPYVTVYDPSTDTYSQELANSRSLRPFEAVFVQINEGTGLKFENNAMSVPASAPAYIRRQQQETPVRTGIKLTGVGGSDKTGFVLSDEYTPAYEIGADLQKMYAGTMNLYSINADNQLLAFNGLSEEDAADPIPVGVTFPQGGEYVFSFDAEQYSTNEIEALILIDKQEGMRVNLKNGYYTFTTNAGTVNDRFAIIIRLAKGTTTDIDPVGFEDGETHKIIKDNHLYIIRDNEMYNAMGGRVR